MYIFLDESGNLKGEKDDVFIVGGFVTHNPKTTAKAFRKQQQKKFFKGIRYDTEVKFSDTRITDALRSKTLSFFCEQDIRIFYTFLKHKNTPLEFRTRRDIKSGHLYAEVVARTLDLLFPTTDTEFRLFLDRRQLKGITQAGFKESLRFHVLPQLPSKSLIQIETVDSSTNPNIQIADWICGALYRHHMQRRHGNLFYDTLHPNLKASQELFKDYWGEFRKNKKSPQKRDDLL